MDWLLKIVEGPMQGAEIALDAGRRVTFGRDEGCDIVVADAGLAERAFTLDVTDEAVTLVAEGDARQLNAFEIQTFGTTGFAIGPATGTWEELRRPEARPAAEEAPAVEAEASAAEPAPEPSPAPVETEAETPEAASGRRRRRALAVLAILLALLAAPVGLLVFGPESVRAWGRGLLAQEPSAAADTGPSIAEIAKSNGLSCVRTNGVTHLSGNLARRTERLAIRALAYAADPGARLDLTDDETLAAAAEALLFTVAGDAVRVVKVANRRLTVAGTLPTRARLDGVLRALSADVPGVESVDAAGVKIGRVVVRPAEAADELILDERGEVVAAPRVRKAAPARKAPPVAGILTTPYRCVVMRDGARCTEGAVIGKARLVKIEADCLTFEESGKTFEWKPGRE